LTEKQQVRPGRPSIGVRRWGRFMAALVTAFVIVFVAMDTGTLSFIPPGYSVDGERQPPVTRMDRTQIADLLKGHMEQLSDAGHFTVTDAKGRQLTVKTFLDPEMQTMLHGLLQRSMAAAGAIAVINPDDGRILGFADMNFKGERPLNMQTLPAASIFKIITAATALENTKLEPLSKIPYNGAKHTLYRSNLTNKITKYTHYVSLRDAFAQSINPVFGKIGIYYVGADVLTEFGEKFRFNKRLPVDVPVPPSQLLQPASDFQIAEVASGFNKKTLISPLHGAWISDIIFNEGRARSIGAVECVQDFYGNVLYSYTPSESERIISSETCDQLRGMMRSTVMKGTARKSFRRLRRKIRRGIIDVGGKTGNINNVENTIKYDWFVGYCKRNDTNQSLVFAVVLLHKEKLGFRAHKIASQLLRRHFKL
jgi:penicillin-binding protein A